MPFRDWPAYTVCPTCQRPTGQFLAAVSHESGKPHYRCTACAHTWIPEHKPVPLPNKPDSPRAA
jgi:rubredoxin